MSNFESHTFDCPKCGQAREVNLCKTLNVTVNPEMRDRLFSGDINQFHCEPCDFKGLVSFPLMYHDMDRAFAVQFYPVDVLEDDGFFKIFQKDGTFHIETLPAGHYLRQPHIVFDMNEMLKYIVFRENVFEKGQDSLPAQ